MGLRERKKTCRFVGGEMLHTEQINKETLAVTSAPRGGEIVHASNQKWKEPKP